MWSLNLVARKQFEVKHLPVTPEPAPGTVRCLTQGVGLCGTDIGSFNEKHTMFRDGAGGGYDKPIGHEWSGTVLRAGAGIDLSQYSLAVGDTVTVYPYKATCGDTCPQCISENVHKCVSNQTLGVQRPGAAVEFFDAPVEALMRTALPPEVAVLHEPLSIGMSVIQAFLRVQGTELGTKPLVIVGGGMIGLACAWAAQVSGWKRDQILVTTRYPIQSKLAQSIAGASVLQFPSEATIEDQISHIKSADQVGKFGSAFVVESTGTDAGFAVAQKILAANGTLSLVGFPSASNFDQANFVRNTQAYVSSRNASLGLMKRVLRHMEDTEKAVKQGLSNTLGALVTHRVSPEQFAAQADDIANGPIRTERIKVLITNDNPALKTTAPERIL